MFQQRATTFTLRAGYEDHAYEFLDVLDQKFTTLGANFRRDLSAATNLQVDLARYKGEFEQSGGEYTDTNAGVALNWGVTRTITLSVSYRYADRNGDAVTGSYTENRLWLSIGFGRGAPRIEPLQPEFAVENPQ
jgi:uncharacterized protein (PEP-CTERM system associated)